MAMAVTRSSMWNGYNSISWYYAGSTSGATAIEAWWPWQVQASTWSSTMISDEIPLNQGED
jgi:hypothetical protein